ncbi:MAG: Mur ligase family protein, partial [Chitinophagaceae bacterium]
MKYDIENIASIINGKVHGQAIIHPVYLVTDSRKIPFPSVSIFFAISGTGRDGHSFIKDAWLKGVRAFVVQHVPVMTAFPETIFIKVADPLQALQELTAFHRSQFDCDVIAITGSNGKTVVKEWLSLVMQQDKIITRSPRSYNSQIGVPLSVWLMDERTQCGVFEAGISQKGEMDKLERIIKPNFGIFTNIGDAHDEGFNSTSEKISEKLKLFEHATAMVYCADYKELDSEIQLFATVRNINLFSWGTFHSANLQLVSCEDDQISGSKLSLKYKGQIRNIVIPLKGKIAVENAMTVIAFLILYGYEFDTISDRMHLLHSISMRLEIKKGIHGCTIINDSYSADMHSLKLALDLMVQQSQLEKRTVIISDFLQSGKKREELYLEISEMLKTYHIQRVIGIGTDMPLMRDLFISSGMHI